MKRFLPAFLPIIIFCFGCRKPSACCDPATHDIRISVQDKDGRDLLDSASQTSISIIEVVSGKKQPVFFTTYGKIFNEKDLGFKAIEIPSLIDRKINGKIDYVLIKLNQNTSFDTLRFNVDKFTPVNVTFNFKPAPTFSNVYAAYILQK